MTERKRTRWTSAGGPAGGLFYPLSLGPIAGDEGDEDRARCSHACMAWPWPVGWMVMLLSVSVQQKTSNGLFRGLLVRRRGRMSELRKGRVVWRLLLSSKHRGRSLRGVTRHPSKSTALPSFQASMLVHVRNALDVPDPSADGRHAAAIEDQARGLRTDIDAKLKRSKRLLEAVDEFCYSRHWMMHVGPSKGEILTRSLVEAVNRKLDGKIVCKSNAPTQFVVLELGAYCGYSSILMGRAMLETMKQSDALNGHVFTTEINPESVRVSESLVRMSGLEDLISINQIHFNGVETNVIEVAREAMHLYETKEIDFLFIDHDKVRRHVIKMIHFPTPTSTLAPGLVPARSEKV